MSKEETNILFFDNGTASHCWRIDGIARNVNQKTPHAIFETPHTNWNNDIIGADLVVFEMLVSPDIVDTCHKQGAKVIFEADDALIDSYGDERKNLMKVEGDFRQKSIDTVAKCDAVTVTNELLKENYARFTDKPIYVLPNYVDFDWYGKDRLNIERNTDEIRIGWFGSQGHLEDMQMVIPALNQILEVYPNVKFVYCGFGGMSGDGMSTEIAWGEDIFKEIPRERREFVPGVNEIYWPMKHRMLDLDIGIAPLVNDYFNTCKTPIKWMEYSILGTPSVCSPILYGSLVDNGNTGFIADSTEEWVRSIVTLIEDRELAKKMGEKARDEVLLRYDIDMRWEDWMKVYQEVLN